MSLLHSNNGISSLFDLIIVSYLSNKVFIVLERDITNQYNISF